MSFIKLNRSFLSILEGQVARLRKENENLCRDRQQLTQQLEQLRAQLCGHLEQGCQLMAPNTSIESHRNLDPSPDAVDGFNKAQTQQLQGMS